MSSPRYRERGIASEYGGHVLQLLLPRERFDTNPDYFPVGADGQRTARGNLCVSNRAALELVRAGALGYVRDNPEMAMLHIWGADVRAGRGADAPMRSAPAATAIHESRQRNCGGACARRRRGAAGRLSCLPRYVGAGSRAAAARQRMVRMGAARAMLQSRDRRSGLHGESALPGVAQAYIDLFDGRGRVFEYYADAILFGGMGFATPSIIVRDLDAYHRMGLRSISCLTFAAFSALAYPVNLETFARATRSSTSIPMRSRRGRGRDCCEALSRMRRGDGSGVPCDRTRVRDGAYLW